MARRKGKRGNAVLLGVAFCYIIGMALASVILRMAAYAAVSAAAAGLAYWAGTRQAHRKLRFINRLVSAGRRSGLARAPGDWAIPQPAGYAPGWQGSTITAAGRVDDINARSAYPASLSLGERQHDAAHCDRNGLPHLGPCNEPAGQYSALRFAQTDATAGLRSLGWPADRATAAVNTAAGAMIADGTPVTAQSIMHAALRTAGAATGKRVMPDA